MKLFFLTENNLNLRLIEYGTAPVDETVKVVNPAYRDIESRIRSVSQKHGRKATRVILRQIFSTEVDLEPDTENKTLNVSLHSLSNERSNKIALKLCRISVLRI